jgi:hypothetical protein
MTFQRAMLLSYTSSVCFVLSLIVRYSFGLAVYDCGFVYYLDVGSPTCHNASWLGFPIAGFDWNSAV